MLVPFLPLLVPLLVMMMILLMLLALMKLKFSMGYLLLIKDTRWPSVHKLTPFVPNYPGIFPKKSIPAGFHIFFDQYVSKNP